MIQRMLGDGELGPLHEVMAKAEEYDRQIFVCSLKRDRPYGSLFFIAAPIPELGEGFDPFVYEAMQDIVGEVIKVTVIDASLHIEASILQHHTIKLRRVAIPLAVLTSRDEGEVQRRTQLQ